MEHGSNPNAYPVRVTDVALDGTDANILADRGHPGCTATGVSFTDQSGLSIDIAPHGAVETTLEQAVTMSNASADGCQGATFTIPVALSGAPPVSRRIAGGAGT